MNIQRIILSVIFCVCLFACNEPSNQHNTSKNSTTNKEVSAPTIKVYIENSGSMNGYVKGVTDFESAVYSYLSDIQLANLGALPDTCASKNRLELNYINSEIISFKPDVKEFIDALEPAIFQAKGGNIGTSDMADIIDTILSHSNNDDISILISDCIFSPGSKYKKDDNADQYLVSQQIDIKTRVVEKLKENPNFSFVIMRLVSQFNGTYYNKFDEKTNIDNIRPFYIWLMGDKYRLKHLLDEVDLNNIKGQGVKDIFMISIPDSQIKYSISRPKPGNGKYMLDNVSKTISDPEIENKVGNKKFQVILSVDFRKSLLPEEYLSNKENYIVSNKAYELLVKQYSGPNKNKYTHNLTLNLKESNISRGNISITLKKGKPSWFEKYTDKNGIDINAPGAMESTYGLKYLLDGVYEAYSDVQNHGIININIK